MRPRLQKVTCTKHDSDSIYPGLWLRPLLHLPNKDTMALIGQLVHLPLGAGQTLRNPPSRLSHYQSTCRCRAAQAAAPTGSTYLGLDFGTSGARAVAINGKFPFTP